MGPMNLADVRLWPLLRETPAEGRQVGSTLLDQRGADGDHLVDGRLALGELALAALGKRSSVVMCPKRTRLGPETAQLTAPVVDLRVESTDLSLKRGDALS
jgi:hypothetical protein